MGTLEEHARKSDFRGMLTTAIITALAFTTGLFWNDAIRSFIEAAVPTNDKISAKFLTAFIVTIAVVIFAALLIKLGELGERHEKQIKKRMKTLEAIAKRRAIQMEKQREAMRKQLILKQNAINKLMKKRKGFF